MKPGNRHENEMVPSHTKRKLWKMRERLTYIFLRVPFCSFLSGRVFYFEVGECSND
jgi:hypothetical protein